MKTYIEISKAAASRLGSVEKAVQNGQYNVWDGDRIKGAFALGHGTEEDFKRYREANKSLCYFRQI